MKHVLSIIIVCVTVGFVVTKLESKHDQSDVERELDRISSEMDNIASLLENPENMENNRAAAINLLRYQSSTIEEFLNPNKPSMSYRDEKIDWTPQIAKVNQRDAALQKSQ